MIEKESNLKEKIRKEMVVDSGNALERNYELAKRFIRITQEGFINVLNKERYTGEEKVLLYLIGKLYAKEGGLVDSEKVDNDELSRELGVPLGSLLPWIKKLRDGGLIDTKYKGKKAFHSVRLFHIEKILKRLEEKYEHERENI